MKKRKYKALISFAGPVSMCRNQERQLTRREAAPLLKAGYIEPVAGSTVEEKTAEPEQAAEQEQQATAEPGKEE